MHQIKLSYIYLSLFAAYLLLLLPWSEATISFKPDFTLLVLIFWLLRAPHLCNIGTAWIVGLFVDLAIGGVFGQHAWAYTVAAFFLMVYQRRLVFFNDMQLFFYILMVLIVEQLTLLILRTFSGVPFEGLIYFVPSIIGVLLLRILWMFKFYADE